MTNPRLTSGGFELDTSPEAFGSLRASTDIEGDFDALRARMADDGYLFLPGFFERAQVLGTRRSITAALESEGLLNPDRDPFEAIAREGLEMYFRPDIANANEKLEALIYGGRMLDFYAGLLGGEVRHYDYTWMRAIAPGKGTSPHCDIVYMGRGTTSLYTAWVPLGDVSLQVGGLMILEGSHKQTELRQAYGTLDVDAICENPAAGTNETEARGFKSSGAISDDPASLRERLGGRWLTSEFRMGDLLTFSMFTVHASLDNHSREIRLSSDSRYQLASEPVDGRWVGDHPIAHGPEAKRGLIC